MDQPQVKKSQWYYQKSETKKRVGPLTDQELKQAALNGQILPHDLLWRAGMPKALPAGGLKGLFTSPVNPASFPSAPNTSHAAPSSPKPEVVNDPSPEADQVSDPILDPFSSESQSQLDMMSLAQGLDSDNVSKEVIRFAQPEPEQPDPSRAESVPGLESDREEQLWNEGVMDEYPIWSGLWRIIDQITGRSFTGRIVIGIILAALSGLICGAIDSINPFVYLSILFFFIAGGVIGMGVYEIFRRTGIHSRILSVICGFFVACITLSFTFIGGMLCDTALSRVNYTPLEAMSPTKIVQYLKTRKDTMIVSGRFRLTKPDPYGNAFLLFILYGGLFAIIIGMSSAPNKLKSEINADPEEAERVQRMIRAAGSGRLYRE
ncbi:MAG: DUF4339 domain-containing protein [Planctomycetia bacterium]|nr:DUF4339 domain-containing protein [Planctomycetia bacterium]